jgi:hypothetical protein
VKKKCTEKIGKDSRRVQVHSKIQGRIIIFQGKSPEFTDENTAISRELVKPFDNFPSNFVFFQKEINR